MKMSKWSILLLALIIATTGCKKKEDEEVPVMPEETGAIFVTVAYNGQPVSGATITTEPATTEVTTNAMGSVLIPDVSEGIYQVFATVDEFGSGSGAVDVDPGDVSDVIIFLVAGAFQELMVNVVSVSPQNATVGENVSITAVVSDDIDDGEDISFEWSTDMDGLISTQGVISGSGTLAMINHTFETIGERMLTVTVTDTDGNTDTDSTTINIVEPPEPVVLEPIEVVDNAMHLSWSETDNEDFISYRVYREGQSGFTLIESIYDINTTSYVDDNVSIGIEYNYQIGLYMGGGEAEVLSNIETGLFDSEYIYIGTGLDMLRQNPNNGMIYGLDTDNNSLLFIDTQLGEVVNTINVGSAPTDMDFSIDNQLLYIANSGSTQISVVDLASQTVQSTFNVEAGTGSWDGNPATLAVLENDKLAFSASGSFRNIKLTYVNIGDNLYTTNQSYYYPYLIANSDGTQLFVAEQGSSSSEIFRFDVLSSSLSLEDNSNDFSVQSNQAFITQNDEYIFHGKRKFLASSLTSLVGTFSYNIYAINSDGSRAVGGSEVYNGYTFTSVQVLPLSSEVSVFGNDDATVWLYHEQTARLYKFPVE